VIWNQNTSMWAKKLRYDRKSSIAYSIWIRWENKLSDLCLFEREVWRCLSRVWRYLREVWRYLKKCDAIRILYFYLEWSSSWTKLTLSNSTHLIDRIKHLTLLNELSWVDRSVQSLNSIHSRGAQALFEIKVKKINLLIWLFYDQKNQQNFLAKKNFLTILKTSRRFI
jgi:hypothetical protein